MLILRKCLTFYLKTLPLLLGIETRHKGNTKERTRANTGVSFLLVLQPLSLRCLI